MEALGQLCETSSEPETNKRLNSSKTRHADRTDTAQTSIEEKLLYQSSV